MPANRGQKGKNQRFERRRSDGHYHHRPPPQTGMFIKRQWWQFVWGVGGGGGGGLSEAITNTLRATHSLINGCERVAVMAITSRRSRSTTRGVHRWWWWWWPHRDQERGERNGENRAAGPMPRSLPMPPGTHHHLSSFIFRFRCRRRIAPL